jgi:hypothetical protein
VNATLFTNSTKNPLLVLMTIIWAHFPDFAEAQLGPLTTRFLIL